MSLVPFRVSGAAASQQLSSQLLQVGPHSLLLLQRPQHSGVTAHLNQGVTAQQGEEHQQVESSHKHPSPQGRLHNVGFSIWQSGFVLADFLLLRLPQLQADRAAAIAGSVIRSSQCSSSSYWCGVRVLELGCGAGTVGMFLALAGAQVVMTDQQHIIPFTLENLHLNFPATADKTAADQGQSQFTGTFGQRGKSVTPAADHAASTASHAHCSSTATPIGPGKVPTGSSTTLMGDAVSAGAVDSVTSHQDSYVQEQQQQQQEQQMPNLLHTTSWSVFQSGPLVVPFTWGEPLQHLQECMTAAAEERCRHKALKQAGAAVSTADGGGLSKTVLQDIAAGCFDAVVGADLLYDPSNHEALLKSLDAACAPHTQVFLCHRSRGLGEEKFEELAAAAGWLVQAAGSHLLHPEFQEGRYRLLCLSRLG